MEAESLVGTKERTKSFGLTGLKKCFQTLVDRKQLNLDIVVLELMLRHELGVDLDKLDKLLASVLPHMLVYYMKNWPGWQKSPEYYSGNLSFKDWFFKFRQYIVVKLNYLIKNGYQDVLNNIIKQYETEINEQSTETIIPPKGVAPFVINIQGAPKFLGTLVFDLRNNDVIINRHIETPWIDLPIPALVNWPYVGIEFRSSEFAFKRYSKNEYKRWLNLTSCPINLEPIKHIEEARIINKETGRSVHSLERLYAYSKQFMDIIYKMKRIPRSKVELMEVLLEEFLKDIKELGANDTFATNTVVLFNIGQQSYLRNKKHSNKESTPKREIGYCEIFIPKMEIQLNYFSALEDTTTFHTSFTYLNNLEKMVTENLEAYTTHIPTLVFRCVFCNTSFDKQEHLLKHFENLHGMEAPFSCLKCGKILPVPLLAQCRWRHECKK